MKKLLLIITILFITTTAFSQYTPSSGYGSKIARTVIDSALFIPTGCGKPTSIKSVDLNRASIYYDSCAAKLWQYNPKTKLWGTSDVATIPGGPITSLPALNNNPGVGIGVDSFIKSQFYASQPPTAALSGGSTFEFTTTGSTSRILSWTAGRQSATSPIASIVVAGVNQTFSQPPFGGTSAGSQIVSTPNNTNTTYTNTVTTTDGRTAQATTAFIYQNKIYAGFVSSATPTDAEIIAATGSSYVGGFFSGGRNQSGALSTPSSSKFVVFVSPASYGALNITINGLGLTYNQTARSFTNASGGVSSYIVAVSPFSTSGAIDSYLVN